MKRAAGFTFIELLVALALLAIGLSAAIRATSSATSNAEALRTRQLATWVAENRVALLFAQRLLPALGETRGSATMGAQDFVWKQNVHALPQATFRRVEIEVFATAGDAAPVAHLHTFLAAP